MHGNISSGPPVIDRSTIERYRALYRLGPEIGESEVSKHWEVESSITKRLLASTKDNRWATFQECYTELYTQLSWLNKTEYDEEDFTPWLNIVPRGSSVFEVGSGKAGLLKFLDANGYKCVATEITSERGEKHTQGSETLEWHTTDGINLTQFETPSSYDVVISTQVVEHLHPDDMLDHLINAREILKPSGCYIFDTPHFGAGPSDVSKIYGFDRAVLTHLKEYTYLEFSDLLTKAGFKSIKAVLYRERPFKTGPYASSFLFKYYCAWDRVSAFLKLHPPKERKFRAFLKLAFVPTRIWLIAEKAASSIRSPATEIISDGRRI